jgi:hypothetical protein
MTDVQLCIILMLLAQIQTVYIYIILTTVDLRMTQILTVLCMQPGQHGFGPNYIVDVT